MIKYLGSKRTLIPAIVEAVLAAAPRRDDGLPPTVLDLFSGTSRVGHALKRAGCRVLANDHTAYAHALGRCYVQADAGDVELDARRLIDEFNALPGEPGYFTATFSEQSRFVHPRNAARIDAIREAIERKSPDPELRAVVLVSLMEAADRVDSTTGVQMAYLKSWAPRAHTPLELRLPAVLPRARAGKGEAHRLDAFDAARALHADVSYLDPPYNQHAYLGNYHVWESLVLWDKPGVYGVACKREDCKTRRSPFNSSARCRDALRAVLAALHTGAIVASISDEGFVSPDELAGMLAECWPDRGGAEVRTLDFDYPRYIGARIGIHNPRGEKVGTVSHTRTTEHLLIARPRDDASRGRPPRSTKAPALVSRGPEC